MSGVLGPECDSFRQADLRRPTGAAGLERGLPAVVVRGEALKLPIAKKP
jgi:hypothetical protein